MNTSLFALVGFAFAALLSLGVMLLLGTLIIMRQRSMHMTHASSKSSARALQSTTQPPSVPPVLVRQSVRFREGDNSVPPRHRNLYNPTRSRAANEDVGDPDTWEGDFGLFDEMTIERVKSDEEDTANEVTELFSGTPYRSE